jgi:dipeptidyl aminopeptidase/acylaminoacyl peptidase
MTPQTAVWVYDFARAARSLLADGAVSAAWSPDGKEIVYSEIGTNSVFLKRLDGGAATKIGTARERPSFVDWSPDGRHVITGSTMLTRTADGWKSTQFHNPVGPISPDGKWQAFSEGNDVFVSSFPKPEQRWQVSANGGERPVWSAGGRELFYRSSGGDLMVVPVLREGNGLVFDPPQRLFALPYGIFDVAADGQRIFTFMPIDENSMSPTLTILTDIRATLENAR